MKRLSICLITLLWAFQVAAAKLPYTHVRIGSATDQLTSNVQLQGGTVLMGGSTDIDAAFRWMCQRSLGGDFLIIRSTGTDAYNPYIQKVCADGGAPTRSVATLIIPTLAAANDPRVSALISKAEAIWIAGGDQSNYINFWKGSATQTALQQRIQAGVPVGGTSAGLNVLTQFVYSAQGRQGVTSSQALLDPFNVYMTFERDFATVPFPSTMPFLAGVIGDPHFAARDRMGRNIAFLCRMSANGWSTAPRGIAVDEQTALLIDNAGQGSVVGLGSVYFLQAPGAPEVCAAKTPLTYRNIAVQRIKQAVGSAFNLGTWTGTGGLSYTVTAERGVLSSTPNTLIY